MKNNTRYIYIPEKDINLTVKYENNMTVIKHCNQKFIDMLIDQNNAWLLEFCYGNLLDNCLYECKKGYMSVNESYVNEWCSDYTVYFSRNYAVCEKFYDDHDNQLDDTEEINTMSIDDITEKYL